MWDVGRTEQERRVYTTVAHTARRHRQKVPRVRDDTYLPALVIWAGERARTRLRARRPGGVGAA